VHKCEVGDPVNTADYSVFVAHLRRLAGGSIASDDRIRDEVAAALDGDASTELRRLVPLAARRLGGLFFTPSKLATDLIEVLAGTIDSMSVLLDPACGAGDLLLAAERQSLESRVPFSQLIGRDLQPEFVEAASLRLALASPAVSTRVDCRTGCGLCDVAALTAATHVAVNPPFVLTDAPRGLSWTSGRTSAAALFVTSLLQLVRPETIVAAILPDVLRSGSRYARWRTSLDEMGATEAVIPVGRFDSWTDIDTFILRFRVGAASAQEQARIGRASDSTVSDMFDITVGAVVHNRDLLEGPDVAFLRSAGLPSWSTVRRISDRRRFTGRLDQPPFLVVRRTSSPKEAHRARATIIAGSPPVAVDNHLIVLKPKDNLERTCRAGLTLLRRAETSTWLNDRIRCRHLTVAAVGEIPWSADAND
jgi:hypothetical protein